jgi:hypothetical protein
VRLHLKYQLRLQAGRKGRRRKSAQELTRLSYTLAVGLLLNPLVMAVFDTSRRADSRILFCVGQSYSFSKNKKTAVACATAGRGSKGLLQHGVVKFLPIIQIVQIHRIAACTGIIGNSARAQNIFARLSS